MDTRRIGAEAVGTFTFFLIGLMAALASGGSVIAIAFGFGLGLFVAIMAFGAISGGHFNPAVTVGAYLDKRIDSQNAIGYIGAQILGGLAAAALILVMTSQAMVAKTVTAPGNGLDDLRVLAVETVFTAIFVLVILTTTKWAPNHAGFAIPLTLVAIHLALVPFTGSSVNPARSIASAVIGADLSHLWVYLVGPVVGSVLGWAVYRWFAVDEAEA
jgi:aquaporin Z